ncbi:MAG: transporter [Acidobacteria bacterium]|nr:transporter [Acidobacteriota bacterium]MYJ03988.1 transporter [Acidobacteriota bacterium]
MHRGVGRAGRIARVAFLVAAVAAGTTGARAQTQAPELVTDRPDQTESAVAVPRGLVQVETGYLFARALDGVDTHTAPGTLVRIGLGGRTELRLGHTGIIGSGGRRGAGDSEIGAKVNVIPDPEGWRPQLAVLGGLSLPTGADRYSSGGADPSFLFAFAHELGPRLSLGYNAGAAWESSPGQPNRDAFVVYSLALGVGLTDRLGTFLEVFGDRQVAGAAATNASVDAGFTLLLDELVQWDVSVGRRLRGPADDLFVGTGLSFRLPR